MSLSLGLSHLEASRAMVIQLSMLLARPRKMETRGDLDTDLKLAMDGPWMRQEKPAYATLIPALLCRKLDSLFYCDWPLIRLGWKMLGSRGSGHRALPMDLLMTLLKVAIETETRMFRWVPVHLSILWRF